MARTKHIANLLTASFVGFVFLFATLMPGRTGVLCFMQDAVQSSCCCHGERVESETPSIERVCCELTSTQTDEVPAVVELDHSFESTDEVSRTLPAPIFDFVPHIHLQRQTKIRSARAPPPDRGPIFLINQTFRI